MERTQISISWWMDKHSVAYPYNGILLGHKNERNTNTYYNIDEPWEYYAKWKKPFITDLILHNFIQMKCPELANLWEEK